MSLFRIQIQNECDRIGKNLPDNWDADETGLNILRSRFKNVWKESYSEDKITTTNLKDYFKHIINNEGEIRKKSALARFYNCEEALLHGDVDKINLIIDGNYFDPALRKNRPDKAKAIYNFINNRQPEQPKHKEHNHPHVELMIFLLEFLEMLSVKEKKELVFSAAPPLVKLPLFVDRDHEMSLIQEHFSDKEVRLIMVTSQSGYGKTALVDNFIYSFKMQNEADQIINLDFKETVCQSIKYIGEKIIEVSCSEHEIKEINEQWQSCQTLQGKLKFLFDDLLKSHRRLVITIDSFENALDDKYNIKDISLQDLIEFIIKISNNHVIIILTSRIKLIFRNRITAPFSNRIKKIVLEGLNAQDGVNLFKELDSDPSCDCGTKDISTNELIQISELFEGRPKTIVDFIAYLKTNEIKIAQTNTELRQKMAIRSQNEIYDSLNDDQKHILERLAGYDHPVSLEIIKKDCPETDVQSVLFSLLRCDIIRAISNKGIREYIVHPLTKMFVNNPIL
jgi:hypothetical protein